MSVSLSFYVKRNRLSDIQGVCIWARETELLSKRNLFLRENIYVCGGSNE